jgi:hypothetical protein
MEEAWRRVAWDNEDWASWRVYAWVVDRARR